MSYSVGKDDEGTFLTIGNRSSGMSSTLTMGEHAVVQLIRLLAATLDEFDVDITEKHSGLLKAGSDMSDKGYQIGTQEGYEAFKAKREANE